MDKEPRSEHHVGSGEEEEDAGAVHEWHCLRAADVDRRPSNEGAKLDARHEAAAAESERAVPFQGTPCAVRRQQSELVSFLLHERVPSLVAYDCEQL